MNRPRSIVVTGGTGALGTSIVERLAVDGTVVHVTYRLENELPPFYERLEKVRDKVHAHAVDLTDEAAVAAFYVAVVAQSGGVDAVVNVAGGFAMAPIESTTRASFDQQIAINLTTTFLSCREAARHMKAKKFGRIVNIGSRAGVDAPGGKAAYVAAKAAVLAFTRSLADELKNDGITVNAVLPSTIDTAANRKSMPNADASMWVKPEDIATVCAFLASAEANVTTGALVPVYGRE